MEIPKPDGGKLNLDIPTVVDRLIQQAIAQTLTPIFDEGFSLNSSGFRPNKNAHQAIIKATEYINEGYKVVVDIDLEKYFERVNHDKLMYLVSKKVHDKRVLKLINSEILRIGNNGERYVCEINRRYTTRRSIESFTFQHHVRRTG